MATKEKQSEFKQSSSLGEGKEEIYFSEQSKNISYANMAGSFANSVCFLANHSSCNQNLPACEELEKHGFQSSFALG